MGHAAHGGASHTLGGNRGSGVMVLFCYEYFFLFLYVTRSDEVWAEDGGGVQPTHSSSRGDMVFLCRC